MEADLQLYFKAFEVSNPQDQFRYRYVVHRIITLRIAFPDMYEQTGVTLNRNKLAQILAVPNKKASQIIKHLLGWQIVTKIKRHQAGKSCTYQLNPLRSGYRPKIWPLASTDGRFIKKVLRREFEAFEGQPLLKNQFETIKRFVRVNEGGLSYLSAKYGNQYLDQLIARYREGKGAGASYSDLFEHIEIEYEDLGLFGLLIGELFVRRPDPKSRIYTNLTSLKRSHRRFVNFDGKPMMMTDLVNSQIVFSIAVITNHLKARAGRAGFKEPAALTRYRTTALSGRFYETLAEKSGIELTEANRGDFKREFFRQLFFSRVRARGGPIKQAFKSMYRPIAVAINSIKKGGHAKFAVKLQRLEAEIMIDGVLKELIQMGFPALSLHDSIIVSCQDHLELAEDLIKRSMHGRYEFYPKFKRE
ncbi:hypothetical protein [Flaviaesturariibacter aridisoli]|uniref:DNA-directed DNA polymerase family A palm domain-containing protein n=1 Tax=Flaviaesturariibacter aridisoli TaxID=2545761 RepID=A0A4R4DTU3_9BACT|nr:hypothetical protein [Flaviaesturariibacter aridisoli]TCZ66431.1 hypothetical protein E0486_16750 [Flaviaesturariibacter aridisoli]